MTGHVTSGEGVVMASKARSGNSSSQFSRNFILTVLPFFVRLWDYLEALEDERTGEEYTIIVLQDSDSDSD